jgi:hypothetical protein
MKYVRYNASKKVKRKMDSEKRPSTAITLSIIGGALILLGGLVIFAMFVYYDGNFGMMNWFGGMMRGYGHMMGGIGYSYGIMVAFMLTGLVSGAIVIAGALMLNAHPSQHITWGIVILIFSVISFLGMGGFFIGAILRIVGGALALSWKPRNQEHNKTKTSP